MFIILYILCVTQVYFTDIVESYIKSISVKSEQGDSFNTIMDNKISLHYYSLYEVPFETSSDWSYRISRLSSPAQSNTHIVRVTSGNNPGQEISLDAWTRTIQRQVTNQRADERSAANQRQEPRSANPQRLVLTTAHVLYARVSYKGRPVINASVVCRDTESGYKIHLLDTGAGDPDTVQADGVYSRYLQYLPPGHHSLSCAVIGQSSYISSANDRTELSAWSRTLCCVSVMVEASQVDSNAPPARILDLSVRVITSSQHIQLEWTAPGDDWDQGKVASYQLFASPRRDNYYRQSNRCQLSAKHKNCLMNIDIPGVRQCWCRASAQVSTLVIVNNTLRASTCLIRRCSMFSYQWTLMVT